MKYCKLINTIAIVVLFLAFNACNKNPKERTDLIDNTTFRVILNPYKTVPLAFQVEFSLNENGNLQVSNLSTNATLFNSNLSAGNHKIDLLGLLPATANELQFTFTSLKNSDFQNVAESITTAALPNHFPETNISKGTFNGEMLINFNHSLDTALIARPYAFNNNGEIVWYFEPEIENGAIVPMELLENGNLFYGNRTNIYELTFAGKKVDSFSTAPYFLHHDIIELQDGNFAAASTINVNAQQFDAITIVDRNTKQVAYNIDLKEILDWNRNVISGNPNDRFHVNSVWQDKNDGNLIVSARHQGIFKIDLNGNLIWILATHLGWQTELDSFLLTPINTSGTVYEENILEGHLSAEDFDYAWTQHSAMLLNNGNLACFDNGFYRNYILNGPFFSRAVEFEIDEQMMTVKQVWQYGKELGEDFLSEIVGDVDEVGNEILILSGINRNGNESKAMIHQVEKQSNTTTLEIDLNFKNVDSS